MLPLFLEGISEVNMSNGNTRAIETTSRGFWSVNFFFILQAFNVIVPFTVAGIGKLQTMSKIWPTAFISKVSLKHSDIHLFTYCLWLLS